MYTYGIIKTVKESNNNTTDPGGQSGEKEITKMKNMKHEITEEILRGFYAAREAQHGIEFDRNSFDRELDALWATMSDAEFALPEPEFRALITEWISDSEAATIEGILENA